MGFPPTGADQLLRESGVAVTVDLGPVVQQVRLIQPVGEGEVADRLQFLGFAAATQGDTGAEADGRLPGIVASPGFHDTDATTRHRHFSHARLIYPQGISP